MRGALAQALPAVTLTALLLSATDGPRAQGLQRPYKHQKLSISYRIPKDLIQIPINRGSGMPHLADKWSATKKPLYGRFGTYEWQAEVRAFWKGDDEEGDAKQGEKDRSQKEPQSLKEAIESYNTYPNYEAWLNYYESRANFLARGKKRKQRRGKKLPYRYFEFVETDHSATWVTSAAAYDFPDREIVISIYYPDEMKKKLMKTVMGALESLVPIEVSSEGADIRKVRGYRLARTAARKKALQEAAANVLAVKGWDLFATEHYIVVYSFDTKPGRKEPRYKYAKELSTRMESMCKEYASYFPPHKDMKRTWSILRICKNYDEFSKYGDTRPGTAGWFNRLSKELVIFDMPKAVGVSTESVAYHEGFHQYADAWFGDAEMHIWFNEGFAEYFGSMGRAGRKWVPGLVQDRKKAIVEIVERGSMIPFEQITVWSQQRFYSGRATDHYAQAWAMIDFLKRGPKSKHWNKDWDRILPTYIKVLRKTQDQKQAHKAAFQGVAWKDFEEAYRSYVLRSL